MNLFDKLFGGNSKLREETVRRDNCTTVLETLTTLELVIGSGQRVSTTRKGFTADFFEGRGVPRVNVRGDNMPGLEDLKGTVLTVRRTKDLEVVGTMTLGLTGSVVYGELVYAPDVELNKDDRLKLETTPAA